MQIERAPFAPPLVPVARGGLAIEAVGMDRFEEVRALNREVFGEPRVIYRLDRVDLLLLLATVGGEPAGFKVGYRESPAVFYSAKGGVAEPFRRRGLARLLLHRMQDEAARMGYRRLAFDTFPNKHPGMTGLGLAEGYRVTAAGYNAAYRDYRLRFERAV